MSEERLDKEVSEASLDAVLKGLGTITSGYLALRIREVEARHDRDLAALVQRVSELESRVDAASRAFGGLKERILAVEVRLDRMEEKGVSG